MGQPMSYGLFLLLISGMVSCSPSKKMAHTQSMGSNRVNGTDKLSFIEGFAITRKGHASSHRMSTTRTEKKKTAPEAAEDNNLLQAKYARLLGVPPAQVANLQLYALIDDWWGVPYQFGGKTREGIDCSAFVTILLEQVYGVSQVGNAADLYNFSRHLNKKEALQEGDLVFFRTQGRYISHVGMYLQNDKFVHASTSSGVMISDLNEAYWDRHFAGAGRMAGGKAF